MWADKAAVKTWTFVSVHIWPGFAGRPSALEPVCDNGGIEHSRAMGGEWWACVLVHMEKSLFFVAEDLMLSPRCAAKIGRLASHGNGWTVTCQRRCFIETLEMVRDVFFFFSQETAQTLLLCVYSPVFALLPSAARLFLTREAGGLSQRSPLGFRSRAAQQEEGDV